MKIRIKIISIILLICLCVGVVYHARSGQSIFEDRTVFTQSKTLLKLWYTDDDLTPYLQSRVVAYNQASRTSRVEIKLVSGIEYLENINKASLEAQDYPDLYIITNDSLEKAYLAGLATNVDPNGEIESSEQFPYAALNAAAYDSNLVGYPYYYETSTLLYNKTYLREEAVKLLEQEGAAASAEAAQEGSSAQEADAESSDTASEETSAEFTDAQINQKMNELLPSTLMDILKFAQSYNAPEGVESVFKWDVTDIFYNYFFIGQYMNAGGSSGDDIAKIDIYNENTLKCMLMYQQLNQFFAIDSEQVTYDSVLDDFINGKSVFTLATTDSIAKIMKAQNEGTCSFEFGVAPMPALDDEMKTRTMSVTNCIAINGYSEEQEKANAFAKFLVSDNTDQMYELSGKAAAHYGVNYGDDNLTSFMDAYANSVPMPKMIETSNLWMKLEIAFTKIWNGANCNDTLKEVSDDIMTQVTGEAYSSDRLPDPEVDITNGLSEETD